MLNSLRKKLIQIKKQYNIQYFEMTFHKVDLIYIDMDVFVPEYYKLKYDKELMSFHYVSGYNTTSEDFYDIMTPILKEIKKLNFKTFGISRKSRLCCIV